MPRGQFIATVDRNVALCREHFLLELRVADFPATKAGQFVQVSCREPDPETTFRADREMDWRDGAWPEAEDPDLLARLAVLRRPFSLAGRRDDGSQAILSIIHRVVGVGTAWMSRLAAGDAVGVLGPLGNAFSLPASGETAVLVGGGVGIPPMLYLAEALGVARLPAVALAGAMTRDLLPLTIIDEPRIAHVSAPTLDEFARHNIPSIVSTDDGSFGFKGFVTAALEAFLDDPPNRGGRFHLYTCGPEAMMKRVAAIAIERGLPCQVAVERAMACGLGTCQSCCIRVKKPDPAAVPLPGSDWCYRLACTDGPVFKASELLW